MNLEEKIIHDMKLAMKAQDVVKRETLRQIKSQLKYYQIEKKIDRLSEDDIITVINRLVKQRNDAIVQYDEANRPELSAKEKAERDVLVNYLPEPLSRDELENLIRQSISECGASDKKQIGLVMKTVMPKVKGKADGRLVNQIAGELLQ